MYSKMLTIDCSTTALALLIKAGRHHSADDQGSRHRPRRADPNRRLGESVRKRHAVRSKVCLWLALASANAAYSDRLG